jgi:negative regulator of flagellin synthesis FlgM
MTDDEDDMIDGVFRGQPPRPPQPGAAGGAAPTAVTPPPASTTSAAETSGLSRIARDLAASPPVDSAKVDRLRAAIAAGTYRPDPDAIAAKMLALETPLSSAKRG